MTKTLFPFPEPFVGDKSKIDVEDWIESFTDACTHEEVDDITAIKLLRSRLAEEAFEWFKDARTSNPDWNFKEYVSALRKRFAIPVKHRPVYSLEGLMLLTPLRGELLSKFVRRFCVYADSIPENMKTDPLLQRVFVKRMFAIDSEMTKRLVKPNSQTHLPPMESLQALTELFLQDSLIEDQFWKIMSSADATVPILKTSDESKDVTALRDEVKRLSVALEKTNSRRPSVHFAGNSTIQKEPSAPGVREWRSGENNHRNNHQPPICFICGEAGHISTYCPKRGYPASAAPVSVPMQAPAPVPIVNDAKMENNSRAPGPAVNIISAEPRTLVLPAIKRPRTDTLPSVQDILRNNLLHPVATPKPLPRTGIAPPVVTKVKSRPTVRVVPSNHLDMVERLFQSPMPIRTRDYLVDNPKFATSLRKQLRQFEKRKRIKPKTLLAEHVSETELDEEASESSDAENVDNEDNVHTMKKFVLGHIHENPVPLQLDNGSDFSVTTPEFAKAFGLAPIPLEKASSFRVANDESVEIKSYVLANISFGPDFLVPVKFFIMNKCPSALLLGLKDQQKLQAEINYGTETCALYQGDSKVVLQLCSLEQLDPNVDEVPTDSPNTLLITAENLLNRVDEEWEALSELPVPNIENALDDAGPDITDEQRNEFRSLLSEYEDLFPKTVADLPGITEFDYTIELEEGADQKPISCRLRRYSPSERGAIQAELETMLEAGVVRPSKSPWVSPVVLVPKKDASMRFCVNYRRLNQLTTSDRFPLPRIDDCLDSLQGKKYFSMLDCMAGYWQVKMSEESTKFTAFITPFGVYEFTVMPFGLKNAPAAFSRMMSRVMADYLYEFVTVYLDDIAVYSMTFDEHCEHLRKVFERCREHRISLKLGKCVFLAPRFRYLGYLVEDGSIRPDPAKVEVLEHLPVPKNIKSVRAFLGLASYFRRFIPRFTEVASPLTKLLSKSVRFDWTMECQEAFDNLRKALTVSPLLKLADREHQFVISTDASNVAIGAVLEQYDDNEELRPVSYASRSLTASERNYTVHEREALALVYFLKKFRCYLFGTRFIAYTDNSAILSLLKQDEPTGRLSRWSMLLLEYDFDLRHRAGKMNPVADFLSRPSCYAISSGRYPSKPITFRDIRLYLDGDEVDGQIVDNKFRRAARRYTLVAGKLHRKCAPRSLLVIETLEELFGILKIVHDQLGHMGLPTVWAWMRTRYWRPQLYRECQHYLASCIPCQQYHLRRPAYTFDGQSEIGGLGCWSYDVMGPIPIDEGYRSVLVGVEHLSSFTFAVPLRSETTLEVIGNLNHIISLFGIPKRVATDNGPCFSSGLFKEFCKSLSIDYAEAVAYQPEWQGMVERAIGIIRYALTRSAGPTFAGWVRLLPRIVFAMNARVSSRTGHSPHYLMFGVPAKLPVDSSPPLTASIEGRQLDLGLLPGLRAACLRPSTHASAIRTFPVNSLVGVLAPQFRKGRVAVDKKKPRYSGPYRVLEHGEHQIYRLESEYGNTLKVHASRLVMWFARAVAFEGGSVIRPMGSNAPVGWRLASVDSDTLGGVEEVASSPLSSSLV
jgi:hypothetical protein